MMLRAFADGADVEAALQKATGSEPGRSPEGVRRAARAAVRRARPGAARAGRRRIRRAAARSKRGQALAAKHRGQLPGADGGRPGAGVGQRPRGRRSPPTSGPRRWCRLPPAPTARARGSPIWPSGAATFAARPARAVVARRRRSHEHRRGPPAGADSRSASATARPRPSPGTASSSSTRSTRRRTRRSAAIAVERKDAALASREFRAALAAGPADPAPAHCDLSEALLRGRPARPRPRRKCWPRSRSRRPTSARRSCC